jgi:uncharacterized lipoprotein NlpE involved in copper resistance
MKATLALILVSGTALVGCTRIIERPGPSAPSVVTTPAISERVVERTAAPAAAGSTAPAACTWASQSYSTGATSCQDHAMYRCSNGTWEKLASPPSC